MATPLGNRAMFSYMAILVFLLFLEWTPRTVAQSPIRTDMPVPPLQWLNLTASTTNDIHSPPPPLMYSSMGYDPASQSLIIFGGESQAGIPQQNTYLLNLQSLTWSTPSTLVPAHSGSPPARSRALGTADFAANSRGDFLLYGGRGANNQPLNDVWAYNFQNQFWVSVNTSGTSPSARWGSFGGIDPANEPNSGNGVSTLFYIAGGSSNDMVFPSSDLYQLTITGTLASDIANIQGIWKKMGAPSTVPGKVDQGGTLISQSQATNARIVLSGGCGPDSNPTSVDTSCIDSSTYALTVSSGATVNISQCPVPRLGPTLVPNLNTGSTAFLSQSFMILGIFDESIWNDDGGLSKGEVTVLDVDAGTWARLLPAGDPDSHQPYPEPREGASAISISSPFAGNANGGASDTIIFGGRDANGKYLNDIWILRAYNATLTQSNASWPGFGNGKLDGGIHASGSGATVQFIPHCAERRQASSTTSSAPTTTTTGPSPSQTGQTGQTVTTDELIWDVSLLHKVLPTVSVATVIVATLLVRVSLPGAISTLAFQVISPYVATLAVIIALALGFAGFAISFTSITHHVVTLQPRDSESSVLFLPTAHSRAGFVLFICLYLLFPALLLGSWGRQKTMFGRSCRQHLTSTKGSEDAGVGLQEKDLTPSDRERSASPSRSAPEMNFRDASPSTHRPRTLSGSGLLNGLKARDGSELSENSLPPRGFEVLNRPRRVSAGIPSHYPSRDMVRSMGDLHLWDRRRSVGLAGELTLSQLGHTSPRSMTPPVASRPPTVALSNRPFVRTPTPFDTLPAPTINNWDAFLHFFFHSLLLANCILILVALFRRAPIAAFVVFLIWTLAFYILMFILAWHGQPQYSILSIIFHRLRAPLPPSGQSIPTELTPMEESETHATPGSSPYIYHQPTWRRAISPEDDRATRTSHGRPLSDMYNFEDNDDEDETERQRRMEEELERREVHIVTVPRRRLGIANPS